MMIEQVKQALRETAKKRRELVDMGWELSYRGSDTRAVFVKKFHIPESVSMPYLNGEPLTQNSELFELAMRKDIVRDLKAFAKMLVALKNRPVPIRIPEHKLTIEVHRYVNDDTEMLMYTKSYFLQMPSLSYSSEFLLETDADTSGRRGFWSYAHKTIHPHALGGATMCLGDFREPIADALFRPEPDVKLVEDLWKLFIERFDVSDVAGVYGLTWIEGYEDEVAKLVEATYPEGMVEAASLKDTDTTILFGMLEDIDDDDEDDDG